MATPATLFRERAAVLIRDLKKGDIQPSEVDEYIRADWDKDSDEYADAYGVTSFAQLKKGVRQILDKRPAGTKRKAAIKPKVPGTRKSVPGPARLNDAEMRSVLAQLARAKHVPTPSRWARAVARAKEALRRLHK